MPQTPSPELPHLPSCRWVPESQHPVRVPRVPTLRPHETLFSPAERPHLHFAYLASHIIETPAHPSKASRPCSPTPLKGKATSPFPPPAFLRLRKGPSWSPPRPCPWAMVHAAVYAVSVSFLFVIFSVGGWGVCGWERGGGGGQAGVTEKAAVPTSSCFSPSPPRQ